MNDPLDLAELARACVAVGFPRVYVYEHGAIGGLLPSFRCFVWEPDLTPEALAAEFCLALRDAVRSVAPCAKVFPVPHHRKNLMGHLLDAEGNLMLPLEVLAQSSELDWWARALVALFRAGLLPEGRG